MKGASNKYNFNQALKLTGAQSCLVQNIVGMSMPADFTYIKWYRTSSLVQQGLFSGGNTNYFGLSLQRISNQWSYIFIMAAPTVGNVQSAGALEMTGINMVALVRDSSQIAGLRYKIYHNSLDVSPGSNTISTYASTVETEFRIGDYFSSNKFQGAIGGDAFIPQVLTSAQIVEHWNKGKGKNNLDSLTHIFRHTFDGNGSDASGNSRSVAVMGGETYESFT